MADTIAVATRKISDKHRSLAQSGLNLGRFSGAVVSAGYGGFFQDFANGRIYSHHTAGTFEVHGGIFAKYRSRNTVGVSTFIGRRELGFPKSDEQKTPEGFSFNRFEWGEIFFLPGTNGGVVISGEIYKEWKGEREAIFGYPVTSNQKTAQFEFVIFERGVCLLRSNHQIGIWLNLDTPMLGCPAVATNNLREIPITLSFTISDIFSLNDIVGDVQDVNNLFKSVFFLNQVSDRTKRLALEIIETDQRNRSQIVFRLGVKRLIPGPLANGTPKLYDLVCKNEASSYFILSPHCIYSRNSWKDFGLLHATDIHVSKRIDSFKAIFREALTKYPDHSTLIQGGMDNVNNWNNCFRDFIRYANSMYKKGVVDGIIATGDIVDYLYEAGDNKKGGGNFKFLRDIILGKSPYPEGEHQAEELLVPIFISLGNHDYRVNPYELFQDVRLGTLSVSKVEQFSSFNLNKKEARIIQGGDPSIFERPIRPASPFDPQNQINITTFYEGLIVVADSTAIAQVVPATNLAYWKDDYLQYYKHHIGRKTNYLVQLGKHKIIMLDSGPDVGGPDGDANVLEEITDAILTLRIDDFIDAIGGDRLEAFLASIGWGSFDETAFYVRKSPNSEGPNHHSLNWLRNVKNSDGIVIVGMHAPPINMFRNEYAHYFRETERPTADEKEIVNFIRRCDPGIFKDPVRMDLYPMHINQAINVAKSKFKDWFGNNKYFKKGSPYDLLSNGVSRGDMRLFLKLMCGLDGSEKPIDLLLCGHIHVRSEMRIKFNYSDGELLYYTDFYTENPARFHNSLKYKGQLDKYDSVKITIREDVGLNEPVKPTLEGRTEYKGLDIPSYPTPLNTSQNKAEWWENHKPLIVLGASLGPTDHNNRIKSIDTPTQPPFQGCKLIIVRNDFIDKIIHVSRGELSQRIYSIPEGVTPVSFGISPISNM
jgi:3',5'-cyclic AMP phosphodiesterase CpdA